MDNCCERRLRTFVKIPSEKFTTWCSNEWGGEGSKAFWTMLKKLHFSYAKASLIAQKLTGKTKPRWNLELSQIRKRHSSPKCCTLYNFASYIITHFFVLCHKVFLFWRSKYLTLYNWWTKWNELHIWIVALVEKTGGGKGCRQRLKVWDECLKSLSSFSKIRRCI